MATAAGSDPTDTVPRRRNFATMRRSVHRRRHGDLRRSFAIVHRILALLAFLVPVLGQAADSRDAVRAAVTKLLPTARIESIEPSAVDGIYEVVAGMTVVYVSADGKHVFQGDEWQVDGHRNLSEQRRAASRKSALDAIGTDQRIVYPARGPERGKVTVFTDVDCGYCRKLHQDIADYNRAGITIEYLFFPRGGLASDSFRKDQAVWCAANRNDALTRAKSGEAIEMKVCPNPVTETFELGRRIGVTGTPMIYAADGTWLGGYLTVAQLVERLGARTP